MFETQYTELALAVDEIAERIRALGVFTPGTYTQFIKMTDVHMEDGTEPPVEATAMIKELLKAHEVVARTARQVFPLASTVSDGPTADLLTQRMQVHEKTAWMLRSLLS